MSLSIRKKPSAATKSSATGLDEKSNAAAKAAASRNTFPELKSQNFFVAKASVALHAAAAPQTLNLSSPLTDPVTPPPTPTGQTSPKNLPLSLFTKAKGPSAQTARTEESLQVLDL